MGNGKPLKSVSLEMTHGRSCVRGKLQHVEDETQGATEALDGAPAQDEGGGSITEEATPGQT